MRRIDAFDNYMKFKGLNDNKVTNLLGLSVGTLSKSRKEGRDLSDKNVEIILNYFQDLNKVYLLTGGEGEMINEGKIIHTTDRETNKDNRIIQLERENIELRNEIKRLNEKIDKWENRYDNLERQFEEVRKDISQKKGHNGYLRILK